ncbi:MAG: hypothetical protein K2X87_29030 [Gemmataceae bacterium]|nr:hypothetical protein [Gemmataceae bacterium]
MIRRTRQTSFLAATAVFEAATGLSLLAAPASVLGLLFGPDPAVPVPPPAGRAVGAALLALGVASWLGRARPGPAGRALAAGLFAYDVAAAAGLAFVALGLGTAGVLLWPGVGIHVALAVWYGVCRRHGS